MFKWFLGFFKKKQKQESKNEIPEFHIQIAYQEFHTKEGFFVAKFIK